MDLRQAPLCWASHALSCCKLELSKALCTKHTRESVLCWTYPAHWGDTPFIELNNRSSTVDAHFAEANFASLPNQFPCLARPNWGRHHFATCYHPLSWLLWKHIGHHHFAEISLTHSGGFQTAPTGVWSYSYLVPRTNPRGSGAYGKLESCISFKYI